MSNNTHLAYGPDRHAVETVMRLHAVKRWHMIDTTRMQTLAEHSANVALLSMMIATTAPTHFFGDPTSVAAYSLVHDVAEAFTGDIPTHTKQRLQGIDELETQIIHPAFKVWCSDRGKILVKICDLADGIRFIRLHGVDATAIHARRGLEQQLEKKFDDITHTWDLDVVKFVRDIITFYAYENAN